MKKVWNERKMIGQINVGHVRQYRQADETKYEITRQPYNMGVSAEGYYDRDTRVFVLDLNAWCSGLYTDDGEGWSERMRLLETVETFEQAMRKIVEASDDWLAWAEEERAKQNSKEADDERVLARYQRRCETVPF